MEVEFVEPAGFRTDFAFHENAQRLFTVDTTSVPHILDTIPCSLCVSITVAKICDTGAVQWKRFCHSATMGWS